MASSIFVPPQCAHCAKAAFHRPPNLPCLGSRPVNLVRLAPGHGTLLEARPYALCPHRAELVPAKVIYPTRIFRPRVHGPALASSTAGAWSPSGGSAIRPATPSRRSGHAARSFAACARGRGPAARCVPRRGVEKLPEMLTGDSLSTASHASPHLATPQTPGTRFAHCFHMWADARRRLRWSGGCLEDGFDWRADVWKVASMCGRMFGR